MTLSWEQEGKTRDWFAGRTEDSVHPSYVVGVRIRGQARADCAPLLRVVDVNKTLRELLMEPLDDEWGLLPYDSSKSVGVLEALVEVLSRRPLLRARLGERARMRQLADDIERGPHGMPAFFEPFRSETLDIVTAVQKAGLRHEFGRPLCASEVAYPEDVVAKTQARLEANPFRAGKRVDDERVLEIARKVYLDVDPWPFCALVEDEIA